jgi:hypothetical protein
MIAAAPHHVGSTCCHIYEVIQQPATMFKLLEASLLLLRGGGGAAAAAGPDRCCC